MNAIRRLLKGRTGFTLVELMVVVVVLGILAGIAVQRMGDVRDRAETAAREANTRLLLGAANLALTRNYGEYMYEYYGVQTDFHGDHNSTIRWMRPCDGPAVTQFLGQVDITQNNYITGYGNFAGGGNQRWGPEAPDQQYFWRSNQEYCLTDYLESFPVGYAVEIVFAARDEDGEIIPTTGTSTGQGNVKPAIRGYHQDRDDFEGNNPYDEDTIYIYIFVGDETEAPKDWDPINTAGGHVLGGRIDGSAYPYHSEHHLPEDNLGPGDWVEIFPVDRYTN